MRKIKAYRYIGRNGIITSRILLEDAKNIPMMELVADNGKILTNGQTKTHCITVELEDVDNWKEIADEED